DLDVAVGLVGKAEALVVVVDGHGQDLLGPVLADHVLVQFLLDGPRGGDVGEQGLGAAPAPLLLVDDRLAQLDALAADVDVVGPLDQGADVAVALAAEGTIGVPVPPGVPGGLAPASPCARVFRRHAVSFTSAPPGKRSGKVDGGYGSSGSLSPGQRGDRGP